jgi:hypothetical protein
MDTRTNLKKESDVIIVRIRYGLGNQLFQYALARHLSIIHKKHLKLDISYYTTVNPNQLKGVRIYCLNHFDIKAEIAKPEDTAPFQKYLKNNLFSKLFRRASGFGEYSKYKRSYVYELPKTNKFFHSNILTESLKTVGYLDGFWQSEKYYISIENIIREDFVFKDVPDEANKKMLAEIDSSNAVSIHIRHGDYATQYAPNHLVLPISYYHQAIEDLTITVKNPYFYVFSDDPDWAKESLRLYFPSTFVSHNSDEKNYEDLRLMSHCKHHIIANSTFSWWGAWLGKKSGQLVYAPKRYYIHSDIPTFDFYPAFWKLIEI